MIELIASGPVRRVSSDRISQQSGHDYIRGRIDTVREEILLVDLEFPQGYVNLEGYAPSTPPGREGLGSVEHHISLGRDDSLVVDEWDVRLVGEWWDWIQAAHRYLVERPHESLVGCLKTFLSWDETRTETLRKAITEAKRITPLATQDHLDAEEWDQLRQDLNDTHRGPPSAFNIPESYAE